MKQNYEIQVAAYLSEDWLDWFDGVQISHPADGVSIIHGSFDQAALYGVLQKLRDLALPLLEVRQIK